MFEIGLVIWKDHFSDSFSPVHQVYKAQSKSFNYYLAGLWTLSQLFQLSWIAEHCLFPAHSGGTTAVYFSFRFTKKFKIQNSKAMQRSEPQQTAYQLLKVYSFFSESKDPADFLSAPSMQVGLPGKWKVIFDVWSACGSFLRHWKEWRNVRQTYYMGLDS